MVNFNLNTKISYKLKKKDTITFQNSFKIRLRYEMLKSLYKTKQLLFNFNNYSLFDYETFEIILLDVPSYQNIPYPRFLDIKLILFFLQRRRNCY